VATEKSTAPRQQSKRSAAPRKRSTAKGSATRGSAPRAESRPRASAGKAAEQAARQLLELTGKQSEGITGLERTEDGWTVHVDVVELTRIPSTTDVLATYEVEVDQHGDLQGYRQLRRFVRGSADGDRS